MNARVLLAVGALVGLGGSSAQAGKFREAPVKLLAKHGASSVAFSADGTRVYAWMGGGLAVIDAATAKQERVHPVPGGASALVLIGDGNRLVTSVDAARMIDLETGQATPAEEWHQLLGCDADDHTVLGVAFPQGKEGAIVVVDATTGKAGRVVASYPTKESKVPGVASLAPDCGRLAVNMPGTGDRKRSVMTLYDVASGKKLRALKHDGLLTAVGWSADGRQVLIGSVDGRVTRYDAASGAVLGKASVSRNLIGKLRGLPDGTAVVGGTVGDPWAFKVLDLAASKVIQELPVSKCDTVMSIAVSRDGSKVAVACHRNSDIGEGTAVMIFHRD